MKELSTTKPFDKKATEYNSQEDPIRRKKKQKKMFRCKKVIIHKTLKKTRIYKAEPPQEENKKISDQENNETKIKGYSPEAPKNNELKCDLEKVKKYYYYNSIKFKESKIIISIKDIRTKERNFHEEIKKRISEDKEELPRLNKKFSIFKERIEAFITIKNILDGIKNIIDNNIFFSLISLGDYFLAETKREINKEDIIKIYLASLRLIAKEKNVTILLSKNFYEPFIEIKELYKLENEIVMTVDAQLYPPKEYDYLERIFVFLTSKTTFTEDERMNQYVLKFLSIINTTFARNLFWLIITKYKEYNWEEPRYASKDFFACFGYTYQICREIIKNNIEVVSSFDDFMKGLAESLDCSGNRELFLEVINKIEEGEKIFNEFVK